MQFSALVVGYGGLSLSSINQEKMLFIANKEPTALTKESKWIQQINKLLIGDQNTRLLIQAIKNSLNFIKGKTAKSHVHTHTQPRPLYADCQRPAGSAHICEDHLH